MSVEAAPPVVDSSSEASSDGEAKGHPDHRGELRCSPRSLVEKGRGDGIVGALGEVGDELDALGVDGPTRADRDDDEAHVGADVAVLVATRVSGVHNTSTRKLKSVKVNTCTPRTRHSRFILTLRFTPKI